MSHGYGKAEWRRDLASLIKSLTDPSSPLRRKNKAADATEEQKTEDSKDGGDGEPEKKEEKEKKPDEEGGGGDSDEGGGVGGSSPIAAGGDTALYLTASQLLRQRDFLLPDIRSLMVRGEVEGLFTIEEKHELNEARIL